VSSESGDVDDSDGTEHKRLDVGDMWKACGEDGRDAGDGLAAADEARMVEARN